MLTAVYIPAPKRGKNYVTIVDATSVHDAARKAIAFFRQPYWKGPKPRPESEYVVTPCYGEHREWRVRAKDVAVERTSEELGD